MNSDSDFAIETSSLMKAFGGTRAVDGIDLAVPQGAVYSLLGPNGAGKTTLIRILATLIRPDSGSARVLGLDVVRQPDEIRKRVSVTGQFASVDDDLTAFENLQLVSRLLGHSRTAAKARTRDLIAAFGLADASGRLVKTFSGGMRRRLDIAASIMVTPDLLFLDEPTTGLDPHSRNQVWEIVRTVVAAGTTVLLTTQNLDEADQLADRLAVMDRGRLIAEGTSGELKASIGSGTLRVRLREPERRADAKRVLFQILHVPVQLESDSSELSVRIATGPDMHDPSQGASAALAGLAHCGIEVTEFALGQPSLDEVFLALTESSTSNHAREVQSA